MECKEMLFTFFNCRIRGYYSSVPLQALLPSFDARATFYLYFIGVGLPTNNFIFSRSCYITAIIEKDSIPALGV